MDSEATSCGGIPPFLQFYSSWGLWPSWCPHGAGLNPGGFLGLSALSTAPTRQVTRAGVESGCHPTGLEQPWLGAGPCPGPLCNRRGVGDPVRAALVVS